MIFIINKNAGAAQERFKWLVVQACVCAASIAALVFATRAYTALPHPDERHIIMSDIREAVYLFSGEEGRRLSDPTAHQQCQHRCPTDTTVDPLGFFYNRRCRFGQMR